MSTKTNIKIEDKSHIRSVTFTFPELMSNNAEDLIREEYNSIINLKIDLNKTRIKVRELEKELEKREKKFKDKSDMFTLEFNSSTKEYKTTDSNIAFKGLIYQYKK